MSDSDPTGSQYNYATSILTSKTPQQSANILPNSLELTSNLVEKNLLPWFISYSNHLNKSNQTLNILLQQGSTFFKDLTPEQSQEYGNLPKLWNCLLNSIQLNIHTNELLYKHLKLESIGPLKDVSQNDIRYSELLINSQELNEISSALSHNNADAEYQWNIKGPQIFTNFENFKKLEKQVYFNSILSFFQGNNSFLTKNLSNNENSTNYLLTNYKIDNEMFNYLNYILKNDFASKTPVNKSSTSSPSKANRNAHDHNNHHDIQSLTSNNSNQTSKSAKRTSKLKSRVGSIFNRKNKKNSNKGSSSLSNDVIPESTASSASSVRYSNSIRHRNGNVSSDSLGNTLSQTGNRNATLARPDSIRRQSADLYGQSQAPSYSKQQPPIPQAEPKPQTPVESVSRSQPLPQSVNSEPLAPQSPFKSVDPKSQEPVAPNAYDSPNVVKYDNSESSSEDDAPVDKGSRLSMLQQHNLGENHMSSLDPSSVQPPQPRQLQSDSLENARSRQSSSGKYSFETGDDTKPIQATPRQESNNVFDTIPQTQDALPEPNIVSGDELSPSNNGISGGDDQVSISQPASRPAPPPSRKVTHNQNATTTSLASHHHAPVPVPVPIPEHAPSDSSLNSSNFNLQQPRSRKDINSQIFHNLPNARESVIQPPHLTQTLVSQSTGNSFLKQNDFFKHNFEDEKEGLNSSIAEIINVTFKNGETLKAQAIGEIAFNYVDKTVTDPNSLNLIDLKIPSKLDKFLSNDQFLKQIGHQEFSLDPSFVFSKTLGGLKYLVKLNQSQIPILIRQIWKFESHQSSLIVIIKLNPLYSSQVTLKNLVISAALNNLIESTSASSKPEGSFNKEKNRITWRYTKPLVLSNLGPHSDGNEDSNQEKLIARILTNGVASEHESGIQVKFSISSPPNQYISILDSTDSEIPSVRNLVSGNYNSHS